MTDLLGILLGIGLVVGLPLSIVKYIDYLYSRDNLTELQRNASMIRFLIVLLFVTMAILAIIAKIP